MILECPDCGTRFRIPRVALAGGNRRVRCGACGHVWRVQQDYGGAPAHISAATQAGGQTTAERGATDIRAGDDDEGLNQSGILSAIAEAVQKELEAELHTSEADDNDRKDESRIASDDSTDDSAPATTEASNPGQELGEMMDRLQMEAPIYGAAGVPAISPRPRPAIIVGWVLWLVFVIGLVAVFLFMQPQLVKAWPPVERLYSMVGLTGDERPHPLPDPDVALRMMIDADPVWEANGVGWTLHLGGTIKNQTDQPYILPELDLLLVGANGLTLDKKSVALEYARLAPRESVRFSVSIEDAPAETTGIVHEWKKRSTQR